MKVRDAMTREVEVISPDLSVHEAARRMAKDDIGALPVGENDRLVGMLTDPPPGLLCHGTELRVLSKIE